MRTLMKGFAFLMLLCLLQVSFAETLPPIFTKDDKGQVTLRVDMFLTTTCPYCQKAAIFFETLEKNTPWIDVHRYFINTDKAGLQTFNQYLKAKSMYDFAVPSIFFCNTRWLGFSDTEKENRLLLLALNYCRTQISQNGQLSATNQQALEQMATTSFYDSQLSQTQGSFMTLLMMVVADVFNGPVFFSVLLLFAFLRVQKNRQLFAGTFIMFFVALAAIHHIQQAHIAFFYQMLAHFRIPSLIVGIGLLAYVVSFHPKGVLMKAGVGTMPFLLLVFLTGVVVEVYQQTHIPNFSLIFRQWLISQDFSDIHQSLLGVLFQLMYSALVILLALAMVWVCRKYLGNKELVKEFSWAYLSIIGLIIIAYPFLLANFFALWMVIAVTLVVGWISSRYWIQNEE